MIDQSGFHCILQVCPEAMPESSSVEVAGVCVEAWKLPQLETRFGRSFEEVAALLEQLPRFFFEPDGSFVWVQERSGNRFQLDGSLYDDGRQLLNVELKGTCDAEMLEAFLTCLGWPQERIVFQFVQRGIYLLESEFRKHFVAATSGE